MCSNSDFTGWLVATCLAKRRSGTNMTRDRYNEIVHAIEFPSTASASIKATVRRHDMILFHGRLAEWKSGMRKSLKGDVSKATHPLHVRYVWRIWMHLFVMFIIKLLMHIMVKHIIH